MQLRTMYWMKLNLCLCATATATDIVCKRLLLISPTELCDAVEGCMQKYERYLKQLCHHEEAHHQRPFKVSFHENN